MEQKKLNDYFHNISDPLLHTYLKEVNRHKLNEEIVSQMIATKTGIDAKDIIKDLQYNIIREAARRWIISIERDIEQRR